MAERITVEHVTKVYTGGSVALRDVSLEVEPGTFLVLLGPSGSGKTTLLRSLAGIERITSGRITIGGTTVADRRVHLQPERRDASMVFQDYALWPHLTVRDNVAFALRRRRLARDEAHRRALAMLDRVGLAALAARYPNELSGGEQQRVALARALVADTGLILCDEPLSNLDADLRERMRVEISSLVREAATTTIYITHDQAEAFALADRVGVLENGRIVQMGAPEEIYTEPATPFVARFTGLSGEFAVRIRGQARDGTVEVEPAGQAHAHAGTSQGGASPGGTSPGGTPGGTSPGGTSPGGTSPGGTSLGGTPGGTSPALWLRARAPREPLVDGGDGVLLVRPTGIRLCAAHSGERHLAGTVADVAFRGRGYEHAIDVPGHGRLTGVFSEVRAARGENVGLRLDPGGCHLFARPEPGPATPSAGPPPGLPAPAAARIS